MADFVEDAYRLQRQAHEVERDLWKRMLQLGRQVLGAFFALYGEGDEGEVLALADGRAARRLENPQTRAH